MHHPLGISRTLKMAGIEMLVRFFLHSVTNCLALYTRPLGTHSGRPTEAFGVLRLPTVRTGVMKLVDQSLKSIETWNVVLSFLQMSPKPAVTFFSAPYANRSRWLVF